jgi:4a-hydroxytetrahydrobiopterin dehydratase
LSRRKLAEEEIRAFAAKSGWSAVAGEPGALEKTFRFGTYRDGVAYAVTVAMAADQRDHHPDMALLYGRVTVRWSTHDAGGVTELDREMSLLCDELAARHGATDVT